MKNCSLREITVMPRASTENFGKHENGRKADKGGEC